MVLAGLTGDATVTPMLMDKLVWGEIKLQGCFTADNDATEAALRIIEETKFPVQEMVSHVFPLKETEKCIRAVGGEMPEMFPTKAAHQSGAWLIRRTEVVECWSKGVLGFTSLQYSIAPYSKMTSRLIQGLKTSNNRNRRRARHRQGILPWIRPARVPKPSLPISIRRGRTGRRSDHDRNRSSGPATSRRCFG